MFSEKPKEGEVLRIAENVKVPTSTTRSTFAHLHMHYPTTAAVDVVWRKALGTDMNLCACAFLEHSLCLCINKAKSASYDILRSLSLSSM